MVTEYLSKEYLCYLFTKYLWNMVIQYLSYLRNIYRIYGIFIAFIKYLSYLQNILSIRKFLFR